MKKLVSEDDIISLFRLMFKDKSFLDDIGLFESDDTKLAFNIDTFVKSSDAPPRMDYYYMGWKAVISTISDLYVKGVSPIGLLISIGISNEDIRGLNALSKGIKDASNKYKLRVVKWDTNSSKDLFLSIAAFGYASNKIPWRRNLKDNDIIVVSDYFGLEGLGLKIMLGKIQVASPLSKKAIMRFCKPTPDFGKYLYIVKKGVNASTDSSDGLSRALWNLSRSSGKKIILNNLPIHPLIQKSSLPEDIKYEVTLYSGEEYIGVFSVPEAILEDAMDKGFIVVGKVEGKGVGVYDSDGKLILDRGWSHKI
jgi:thiamine-monophosphate kinase